MANLQQEFESTLNLGSGSDDSYVTEIADEDLEALKSKISRSISETNKFSAYIVHKQGQPARLMISMDEKKAKSAYTKSMRPKPTKKLLVRNVPPTCDKEHLQMFFEYERGQGGGQVKHVTLYDDRSAVIEFEEAKSVDVVLRKAPIKMLGETVDVRAFVPYLDPGESIDSMNVDGLPGELSMYIASLSFEQGKLLQRGLKEGDCVRVKRSVQMPFYEWGNVTHKSIGTVNSFSRDDWGRPCVYINFPEHLGWQGCPFEMEIVF